MSFYCYRSYVLEKKTLKSFYHKLAAGPLGHVTQIPRTNFRVAAVKRSPVHHHSADYIFWFFGIIELILIIKNRVLLKLVLVGFTGVAHFITGHE